MKRLSKEQKQTHEEILKRLTDAKEALSDAITERNASLKEKHDAAMQAIEEYNNLITESVDALESLQNDYNEAREAAQDFMDEVGNSIQDYIDERSEKWQEGDKGQEYVQWKEAWDEQLDDLDIIFPDEIEVREFEEIEEPPFTEVDTFTDLPVEPG